MVQWCAPALENLMGLARDHGDVVALPQFGVPFYLFNHPEQIEEILRSKPDRFKKASLLAALRPLLGNGLFTSEGEVWRQHRIAAQPLFATKKIPHYTSKVVDSAIRLTVERIESTCNWSAETWSALSPPLLAAWPTNP